jgi:hypothetical protein
MLDENLSKQERIFLKDFGIIFEKQEEGEKIMSNSETSKESNREKDNFKLSKHVGELTYQLSQLKMAC